MRYHLLIGTRHKSGTVWMLNVFRGIASELDAPFIDTSELWGKADRVSALNKGIEDNRRRCVFFNYDSRFPKLADIVASPRREFRGIHLIRDPRDILVSAARYHCVSQEEWLLRPQPELQGRTYQDAIRALSTLAERIEFEMEFFSAETIKQMVDFAPQGVFCNVKYEDLIDDRKMIAWRALLADLGLEPEEIARALPKVWENSLFGEAKEDGQHIFSGKSRQWVEVFDRNLKKKVHSKFGRAIAALGYL